MRITKDLLSGLIFLSIGALIVVEAASYQMGTLLRMEPGYFPTVIGSLIIMVGVLLAGKGMMHGATRLPPFSFRPLVFLLSAILAFGLSLERIGLVGATLLLVVIGRMAAQRPMSWRGTAALSAALVAVAILIFWYLLELPMKLWP